MRHRHTTPVRDVRDQVPRQAADLRRAAVDPPPHRQRQRVFGALFDPRQRILHPGARASGGAGDDQPPGPRRCSSRATPRAASSTCCARMPSAPTPATPRCSTRTTPAHPAIPRWPGLARELARMNLSLNFYTQWYWKTDLHNLMHFLSLRADPHAQYEIRAYAEAMLGNGEAMGANGLRRVPRIPHERPRRSRRPASR